MTWHHSVVIGVDWCGRVVGCVTSMVDERGSGCGQQAALGVMNGRDGGG